MRSLLAEEQLLVSEVEYTIFRKALSPEHASWIIKVGSPLCTAMDGDEKEGIARPSSPSYLLPLPALSLPALHSPWGADPCGSESSSRLHAGWPEESVPPHLSCFQDRPLRTSAAHEPLLPPRELQMSFPAHDWRALLLVFKAAFDVQLPGLEEAQEGPQAA